MSFNKKIIISVDTEADWFDQKTNAVSNINSLYHLQDECDRFNIALTYLITYEVASTESSLKILDEFNKDSKCEIGSHLHVWSTPPFQNPNKHNVDVDWYHGFQSELPDNLLDQKLSSLHNVILKNLGVRAQSHRAGRWGVDIRTLSWLEKNNYLVDSSISSRKFWFYSKGVKEYIKINALTSPNNPYYPSRDDIAKEGKGKNAFRILEVPVTGIPLRFLSNTQNKGLILFSVIINKLGNYNIGNISFRPSYDIGLKKFEHLIRKLFESDIQIYNFMLHSNELAVGKSPYSKTENSRNQLLKRIQLVFRLADEYGINGIKLSDVAALY